MPLRLKMTRVNSALREILRKIIWLSALIYTGFAAATVQITETAPYPFSGKWDATLLSENGTLPYYYSSSITFLGRPWGRNSQQ